VEYRLRPSAIQMPLANGAYLTPTANIEATTTDESSNTTSETLDRFGDPLSETNALGNTTAYTLNDNSQVTEMVQPTVVNGASTAAPTTYFTYDSDGNLHTEESPDGSTQTWTYSSYATYGGDYDEVTEYTDGLGNDTVDTYGASTGDLLSSEQYVNGTTADNTGQNTTAGGDPITTYVYTGSPGGGSTPPAGLVQSTTDADGYVTACSYDEAGNPTAESQGQMVALSSDNAVYSNLPQSPGLARTYTIYVNAAPSSGHTTVTESGTYTPTFTYSGSSTTPLGSGWYELGTVALVSSDTSGTVTVNYTGGSVTDATLLEQTSAIVYNTAEDPVSITDGLNNVSSMTYDNLDRPITTSQGQSVALASNYAVFNNVPQSPGQTRTLDIYVNAAPSSGHTTVTDSDSGSPTFTYSGSSTTPLGSGWYLLGTIVIASTDASSTVTVEYTGGSVTQVALVEQTSLTAYDAYSNVVSQTDGLNRVATYAFNNVEQQTFSSAGQTVPLVSGSATLPNLPQTPGNARTFTIYVEGSATSSGDTTITDSASGSPTFTYSGSSTTPLGNGWYELGTVVLAASDTSTALTVAYSGGGETNVSVVQQMSADSYTPTGLVSSETSGNGNISVSSYFDCVSQT
jgi:YD repeat-containing protein